MTPFQGNPNSTVSISVSGSSQRVAIQTQASNSAVLVANNGTAVVFISFGGDAVTTSVPNGSTAGGRPVLPGTVEVMRLSSTHVAAIAADATGSIYFTPGEGI